MKEVMFFDHRTKPGAVYVFDDVTLYNHSLIHNYLLDFGEWKQILTSPRKLGYIKL